MASNSIVEVRRQLEQISEEFLALLTGRRRFSTEKEFVHEGRDLHRRLVLCIRKLRELEGDQTSSVIPTC
jgi:hypothetical protein